MTRSATLLGTAVVLACGTQVGNPSRGREVFEESGCDAFLEEPVNGCAGSRGTIQVRNAAQLVAATFDACPGDTIELGPGRYRGRFKVPPGVVVAGPSGGEVAQLDTDTGAVLCLSGGDEGAPTTVRDAVVIGGETAVFASGGHVELEGLDVEVSRGFGVVLRGTTATLARTAVNGFADDDAGSVAAPDPARHPVIGLLATEVTFATTSDVTVAGFTGTSVVLHRTTGTLDGLSVERFSGVGVAVDGGEPTLNGTVVRRGLEPQDAERSSFGVVAIGATVVTDGLEITDQQGVAWLQMGGESQHADVNIGDNRSAGFWVQGDGSDLGPRLQITGGQLDGHAGASILALGADSVTLEDLRVHNTSRRDLGIGDEQSVPGADGVQLANVRSASFEDLDLEGHHRVHLLLHEVVEVEGTVTIRAEQEEAEFGLVDPAAPMARVAVEYSDPRLRERDRGAGPLEVAVPIEVPDVETDLGGVPR